MKPGPRVIEFERTERLFEGRYKQHDIRIDRDDHRLNWYITVRAPDGCYVYDGWWRDSAHKTMDDAIFEACCGAMLIAAPQPEQDAKR